MIRDRGPPDAHGGARSERNRHRSACLRGAGENAEPTIMNVQKKTRDPGHD